MAEVSIGITVKDNATAVMQKITSGLKGVDKAVIDIGKGAATGFGKFNEMLGKTSIGSITWSRAIKEVYNQMKIALDVTTQYANEVRKLSANTQLAAEDASLLMQATEDYGLATEDLITAQKRLADQGKTLSRDTLAQIATAYNNAGTAADKSRILTENFGKSGTKWAELMRLGVSGIDQAFEGVNQSLIMDDATLKSVKDYELAVDDLADAWKGVQIEVGSKVIPELTKILTDYTENHDKWFTRMSDDEREYTQEAIRNAKNIGNQYNDTQMALNDYARAWESISGAYEGVAEGFPKGITTTIDDLNSGLEETYDLTMKISGIDTAEAMKDLANQMLYAKLAADDLSEADYNLLESVGAFTAGERSKAEAIQAVTDARLDGKITDEEYLAVIKRIQAMPNEKTFKYTTILQTVRMADLYLRNSDAGTGRAQAEAWQNRASGGWLDGRWTLVGDMPGGRPTAHSELISPEGYVYNAQQTKKILASGGDGYTSRAYGGIGWDWNTGGGGTAGKPPPPRPGGASGGGSTPGTPPPSSAGATATAAVVTAATATTQAANQNAAASAQVAQVTTAQIEAQTAMSNAMLMTLQDINAKFDRLPLQIRDAVQQVV